VNSFQMTARGSSPVAMMTATASRILKICYRLTGTDNNVPDRLQAPNPTAQSTPFGRRVLVADFGGNKIAIVGANGHIEWQFPAEKPQDVWMLKNGNILFSHLRGAKEITLKKQVMWEYCSPAGTEVQSCQPLPDGQVLVVECGTKRLLEISSDGTITRKIQFRIKTKGTHNQMRGSRRTSDGRYWVSAKAEPRGTSNSTETVLSCGRSKFPGDPHDVRELPNGNIPRRLRRKEAHFRVLINLGEVVWNLSQSDLPNNPLRLLSGFQRACRTDTPWL